MAKSGPKGGPPGITIDRADSEHDDCSIYECSDTSKRYHIRFVQGNIITRITVCQHHLNVLNVRVMRALSGRMSSKARSKS